MFKRVMRLVAFYGVREWVDWQVSTSIEHSHKMAKGYPGHPERTEEIRVLNLQAVPVCMTKDEVKAIDRDPDVEHWKFERIIVYIGNSDWVDSQVARAVVAHQVLKGAVVGTTLGDISVLAN